jgi:hypothetical protein
MDYKNEQKQESRQGVSGNDAGTRNDRGQFEKGNDDTRRTGEQSDDTRKDMKR